MTLYHYTTQAAFLSILESKALWATDLRYVNDSAEIEYFIQNAKDRAVLAFNDGEFLPIDGIEDFLEQLRFASVRPSYSVAFSENRDLLSQWRAYAPTPGDVAIGFDESRLKLLAGEAWVLKECNYSRQDMLDRLDASLRDRPETLDQRFYENFLRGLFEDNASEFKHPAFAEEQEVRLVFVPETPSSVTTLFRPGRSTLIPYITVPIRHEKASVWSIDEVVIGPTPHPNAAQDAMEQCLREKGIAAKVGVSSIPFRNW